MIQVNYQKCGSCKGTGWLPPGSKHPGINDGTLYQIRAGAAHPIGPKDYEYQCPECGGTGLPTKPAGIVLTKLPLR